MEGHIVIGIQMIERHLMIILGFYSEDFITRIKGCIVKIMENLSMDHLGK